MPKYRKKPVEVEAVKFEVTSYSICEIAILAGDQTILFGLENDSPVLRIPTKEGEMIARVGDYIIKGVEGEIYACKPKIFEKTYDRVDLLKKARKMAELSGMITKNGFNFTEKESEIDNNEMARGKLESLKRAFEEGRIKSSSVTNFPIKDNYGQWQYGEAEYTFRVSPSTLIEGDFNMSAKIHNIPASAITGIDADLSGINLNGPGIKTAKTKDLSVDKLGPIESPEISPASSFEIEREAHKKLIKELIREVLSEEPVTVSLDGKEIAEACAKTFTKSMKRQDARSK